MLYRQASDWHKRPSELLAMDGAMLRHDFDSAVWHFGTWVESELDKVRPPSGRGKPPSPEQMQQRRENRLRACLADPVEVKHIHSIDELTMAGIPVKVIPANG